MKRIKAACIEQIMHFPLNENFPHDEAVKAVQQEYAGYKLRMDKAGIKYKLIEEKTLEDGSIQIQIKKQYNTSPVGNFLD